jgi:2-polyprenyl-3-methyl-5-hydroxy-6-metoxy-1,4-benzoquinol methylase
MGCDRMLSGTEGYAEEAENPFRRYENISFADVHASVLHLIPTAPCRVLDIGSGTGRNAAALAAMGHGVVAIEPTAELRLRAARSHPSPRIEWLEDSLPDLTRVAQRGEQFGLVMLTAVWMHLDEPQRRRAMRRIAFLVRADGVVIMTLRHGPVPRGRRMFAISADETIGWRDPKACGSS